MAGFESPLILPGLWVPGDDNLITGTPIPGANAIVTVNAALWAGFS